MPEPRCPRCGARVRPEDQWCSLCLAGLAEQPAPGDGADDGSPAAVRDTGDDEGLPARVAGEDERVETLLAELSAYERAPLAVGPLRPLLEGGRRRTLLIWGLLGLVLATFVVLAAVLGALL